MPAPKKKGFRKITVDDCLYVWRSETIRLADSPSNSQTLYLDRGAYDVWLYMNDRENRPPDFEPHAITPKFVAEAIRFARRNGWSPESEIGTRTVYYREKKFLTDISEGDTI